MEGVITKRADSVYQPGKRTGLWSKYRLNLDQEFVIGGYSGYIGMDRRQPPAPYEVHSAAGRQGTEEGRPRDLSRSCLTSTIYSSFIRFTVVPIGWGASIHARAAIIWQDLLQLQKIDGPSA
jgi:hypothetical protein